MNIVYYVRMKIGEAIDTAIRNKKTTTFGVLLLACAFVDSSPEMMLRISELIPSAREIIDLMMTICVAIVAFMARDSGTGSDISEKGLEVVRENIRDREMPKTVPMQEPDIILPTDAGS